MYPVLYICCRQALDVAFFTFDMLMVIALNSSWSTPLVFCKSASRSSSRCYKACFVMFNYVSSWLFWSLKNYEMSVKVLRLTGLPSTWSNSSMLSVSRPLIFNTLSWLCVLLLSDLSVIWRAGIERLAAVIDWRALYQRARSSALSAINLTI